MRFDCNWWISFRFLFVGSFCFQRNAFCNVFFFIHPLFGVFGGLYSYSVIGPFPEYLNIYCFPQLDDIHKAKEAITFIKSDAVHLVCLTRNLQENKSITSKHLRHKIRKLLSDMCAKRRFRSTCAFAQSDKIFH